MSEFFSAGVQYDDYKGTVAADDADLSTLFSALNSFFELDEKDEILGVSVYANYLGNTSDIENLSLTILVSAGDTNNESSPVEVKKFNKDISLTNFFKLFKRFELTLSNAGGFEGKKYKVIENILLD